MIRENIVNLYGLIFQLLTLPKVEYKLEDLIDIPLMQDLQEKLNAIYSFPSAIIDNDGNILTAVAWQDICTKFHRVHPECVKECIKSDQYIYRHLDKAKPAVSYQCPHGLVDNATPIVIDGMHLGNFFTGQFFLEQPDVEFFRKQAHRYGFDEQEYLDALSRVPIWTREKLNSYLDFIKGFIEIIAGIGLKNLKEKETVQIVKKIEERYQTILQGAMDGFWLMNPAGQLIEVNDTYCNLSGYTREELLSMKVMDIEASETPVETAMHIQKVKSTGEDRFVTKHRRKDGSLFDVEISVKYHPDLSGDLVAFLRDITEKKQAEEQLVIAKQKAEESNRLKTAFLQNMSHEIRTPMNAIMGFSELLPMNFNNKDKLTRFSGVINQRSKDLLEIINDILDISRIESGQLPVHKSSCNITSLFAEIDVFFSAVQFKEKKKHVTFDIVIQPNLNPADIYTDRVKLKQIFINLITNAFKFTPSGRIETGCSSDSNGNLIFHVTDTGMGIPKEKHHLVFQRFVQFSDKSQAFAGGTGLGLSIVKGLIQLLGGTIWFESEPEKGSSFYFTINEDHNIVPFQENSEPGTAIMSS
jgi:PAS domain S-box-containing protein